MSICLSAACAGAPTPTISAKASVISICFMVLYGARLPGILGLPLSPGCNAAGLFCCLFFHFGERFRSVVNRDFEQEDSDVTEIHFSVSVPFVCSC
jgi:hypothetical protein